MVGMSVIATLRRVEELANELNFQLVTPKYSHNRERDYIALIPVDDNYPIYSRDAEIRVGGLRELEEFLLGVQWMKEYLSTIKACDSTTQHKKEQSYRNKRLLNTIKETV